MKLSLKNRKIGWLAKEYTNGWYLRFFAGNNNYGITGLRLRSIDDVRQIVRDDTPILFVFMAENKKRCKEDKQYMLDGIDGSHDDIVVSKS